MKRNKMLTLILTFLASYLILGLVIHHWIVPVKNPAFNEYFIPGTSFRSNLEGLTQTVVKIDQENLVTDIEIQPGSKGPVTHFHENFDEKFLVKSGTLSIQVGTEIRTLTAGQSIVIPRNTPHRPFNESQDKVLVTSEMPLEFAYCLSQIYPFWDENNANSKPPKILFQLAVFGGKFDSFPTEDAPPQPVLKALKFLLAPTARLLGYQNYNENYKPGQKNGSY